MKRFRRGEKGAAEVVALLIGIVILISLMISGIDATMYFNTRSSIQAAARDGARTVAIFGGAGEAGSDGRITELQKAYGDRTACSDVPSGRTNGRLVECEVYNQLQRSGTLQDAVEKVTCGPIVTSNLGQPTYCDIQWNYKSLPGSPMTIFSTTKPSSNADTALQIAAETPGRSSVFNGTHIVTGTSQSEVKLTDADLVAR